MISSFQDLETVPCCLEGLIGPGLHHSPLSSQAHRATGILRLSPSHRPSISNNGASDPREGREEEGGRRRQGDLDSRSEGRRVEERRRGRELQESRCRSRLGLGWAPLEKGQGLPCNLEIFSFQTACPCPVLFLFLLLVYMILRTILKNKARTEITSCCWKEENPKTSSTHPVPSELNRALTAPFPAGVLVGGGG